MVTLKKWAEKAVHSLQVSAPHCVFNSALKEARLLLAHTLKWNYEKVFFTPTYRLTQQEEGLANSLLERRINHEPLSKIIQTREFWSHSFKVTHHTLDPRPDTETLIEAILKLRPLKNAPLSFLELGTGTGCVIISLLLEYIHGSGIGVDISQEALKIAVYNREAHHLTQRLTLKKSDWFKSISGTFDVIVSNPPYISKDEILHPCVYDYDPHIALFADNNGLAAYEIIAKEGGKFLTKNGIIVVEVGYTQKKNVIAIFKKHQLFPCFTYKDLNNISRCLVFCKKTLEKENKS